MSTLELRGVGRRYGLAPHERVVLHDLSLTVELGELVAIWGLRRSGRSTLLRIAAGVEQPDEGTVWHDGRPLEHRLLGGEIAYCPRERTGADTDTSVLDALMFAQLARGSSLREARGRAHAALKRTGAGDRATSPMRALDTSEQARVELARALTLRPSLILLDEPLTGVDLLQRDSILALLRALADYGTTIVMSTGEASGLAGADRALTLSHGRLHGHTHPQHGELIQLRPRVSPLQEASGS